MAPLMTQLIIGTNNPSCIVPKIGYSLELLPPHLVADSAAAAHQLVVQAYCDINDITAEEAAAVFNRLALPPSGMARTRPAENATRYNGPGGR